MLPGDFLMVVAELRYSIDFDVQVNFGSDNNVF